MGIPDHVKPNTRWRSRAADPRIFLVLHVIELDGHTWVHYRDESCPTCHEFSCYLESFVSRFDLLENEGV